MAGFAPGALVRCGVARRRTVYLDLSDSVLIDGAELAVKGGGQVVRTDAQGRFQLGGIGDSAVMVIADSTAFGRSSAIQVEAGRSAELVLVVDPIGQLAGQVTVAGQPTERFMVTATAAKGIAFHTMVDHLGRYHFTRLGAGDYCIAAENLGSVAAPDDCKRVTVSAGATATLDLSH